MLKSVSLCDHLSKRYQERDDDHLRLDCHHDHDQGLFPETLLAPPSRLLPVPSLILQQEVHHHHDYQKQNDYEDDLKNDNDDEDEDEFEDENEYDYI